MFQVSTYVSRCYKIWYSHSRCLKMFQLEKLARRIQYSPTHLALLQANRLSHHVSADQIPVGEKSELRPWNESLNRQIQVCGFPTLWSKNFCRYFKTHCLQSNILTIADVSFPVWPLILGSKPKPNLVTVASLRGLDTMWLSDIILMYSILVSCISWFCYKLKKCGFPES